MDASTGTNGGGRWLKAVIFDLDGTLIDSLPDIAETLNDILSGSELEPASQ